MIAARREHGLQGQASPCAAQRAVVARLVLGDVETAWAATKFAGDERGAAPPAVGGRRRRWARVVG